MPKSPDPFLLLGVGSGDKTIPQTLVKVTVPTEEASREVKHVKLDTTINAGGQWCCRGGGGGGGVEGGCIHPIHAPVHPSYTFVVLSQYACFTTE